MKCKQIKRRNTSAKLAASALAMALCAMATQAAQAVEAGKLVVYSHLSEPLVAAVALAGDDAKDPSDIQARVAGPEAYAAAGVKRPDWADSASLTVERADKDRFELKIRTASPVESPASSLIVEIAVKGAEEKLSREYAVILDPAEEPKVSATAAPRTEPKSPMAAASAGGQSLVVKSGQVLSGIAQAKRPSDVSVERMMVGLLRANPNAFVGSNINRLKAGAILRMPERPELEAIRQAAALDEVNRQAGEYSRWRSQAAAAVPQAEPKQSGSQASGKIGKVEAAPEAGPDVLKLGKADKQGRRDGAAEKVDSISKQKELDDSKARMRDLEKMRDDLQKLLTVRDQQLADALAQAKDAKAKLAAEEAAAKNHAQAAAVAKPDAKAEAKPDAKAEAKPDAKAEAKPDAEQKMEPKPDAAADAKPEASAEAKPDEPKAEAAPAPEAKPEPVKAKPAPAPAPAPAAAAEPTMADVATGYAVQYGPYAGGAGVLALLAGLLFSKRKGKKRKMMATTISPDSLRGESRSAHGEPAADEPTDFEDRINSADTYIAFDQPEKAVKELEEALKISPNGLEALIRLARIASKASDRSELGRLSGLIGDATFRSGPYWEEVDSMMAKFAKPETEQSSPVRKDEVSLDMSAIDLEKSLMDLAGSEAPAPKSEDPMGFDINVASEPAKPAAQDPAQHGMEMNFELPSFDIGSVEAPKAQAPAKAEEPASFDSLSFDLGLPDDKPSAASFEMGGESMDFNVPAADPSPESDAEGELRTMLELAKAYMDMGDRDGSRELLDEIAASGSPALAKQAKDMLASL